MSQELSAQRPAEPPSGYVTSSASPITNSTAPITTSISAIRPQRPVREPSERPLPLVSGKVSDEKWNDWKWQMSNRLRSLEQLMKLPGVAASHAAHYEQLIKTFHYSITPYYLSLIDWAHPMDPVRMQSVPDLMEMSYELVGDEDPLEEEEDMQVPGLVHRYPDRVLAVVTAGCAMYCRHCTRKRKWADGERTRTKKELQAMADYVKKTSQVREVVVSGGDPLTMNESLLDWFLGELQTIEHLEVVRIGTRVPVVMPMRITEDLASMLGSHRPLWVNTQFNHPREITPEATLACDRLQRAGIPVSNQSVLLRGINDSVEVMKALSRGLQRIMVRPYYLYQCDPVKGVEHFRTSIWKGIEIVEGMRGHTSGMAVPTFVVDATGGGGKIPLQPFYLLSVSEREVLLRNYEGAIIRYFNPAPQLAVPQSPGLPVNAVPQNSERMKRRNRKAKAAPSHTLVAAEAMPTGAMQLGAVPPGDMTQ